MTVTELIEVLRGMPPDADVKHLWDGEPRSTIEHVWLAKGRSVVTSDYGEICYSDEGRPIGAPDPDELPYWRSPRT